jgi:hypothetical protein
MITRCDSVTRTHRELIEPMNEPRRNAASCDTLLPKLISGELRVQCAKRFLGSDAQ